MKKLIMFTLVAVAAVAVNAANVNWKLTGWYAPSASAEGAMSGPTEGTALTTANTVFSLYVVDYSGGSAGSDVAVPGATVTLTDGNMGSTTLLSQGDAVTMRDTYGDSSGNVYLKLIATYEDDSYTYSFEQTVKQSLKNITSQAKTYNFQGYAADGWTATSKGTQPDVPEPTSGILLLVGGAMLALRRKRA